MLYFLETRHACDQGDNLDSYTWTEYDTREGGVQVIKDSSNNVKITTEFLKVAGGDHGGSWAVRVKGEPMDKGMSGHHFDNYVLKFCGREIVTYFYYLLLWLRRSWWT